MIRHHQNKKLKQRQTNKKTKIFSWLNFQKLHQKLFLFQEVIKQKWLEIIETMFDKLLTFEVEI
ncbi:MAG: hypothetical protein CVT96_09295 [Bacteroidetes bacterium HGW-Bacteroidetes-13]|nr:MAG: hypothetical protein CVT96_09295 [Bacteroidetes bacterium HGW-Bacteroidetes-13]